MTKDEAKEKGCVCYDEWQVDKYGILDICDEFIKDSYTGDCINCEHNEECHNA